MLFSAPPTFFRRTQDKRKRRDLITKQVRAFDGQMEAITDAYIDWASKMGDCLDQPTPPPPEHLVQKGYAIRVVDVFRTW